MADVHSCLYFITVVTIMGRKWCVLNTRSVVGSQLQKELSYKTYYVENCGVYALRGELQYELLVER